MFVARSTTIRSENLKINFVFFSFKNKWANFGNLSMKQCSLYYVMRVHRRHNDFFLPFYACFLSSIFFFFFLSCLMCDRRCQFKFRIVLNLQKQRPIHTAAYFPFGTPISDRTNATKWLNLFAFCSKYEILLCFSEERKEKSGSIKTAMKSILFNSTNELHRV